MNLARICRYGRGRVIGFAACDSLYLAKSIKVDGNRNEEWLFVIDEKCLPLRIITSEVTMEQIVSRVENWIEEYKKCCQGR